MDAKRREQLRYSSLARVWRLSCHSIILACADFGIVYRQTVRLSLFMYSSEEEAEFDIVFDATGVQPYMFEPLPNVNSE